jgi:hypothetical protein
MWHELARMAVWLGLWPCRCWDVWPCGPTPLEAELSWPFGRPWQMDVGAGELACGNRSDLWQRDMDEGALRNLRLLITYTCPNPLAHLPILTHINTQVRTLRALWAVRPQCRDATHAENFSRCSALTRRTCFSRPQNSRYGFLCMDCGKAAQHPLERWLQRWRSRKCELLWRAELCSNLILDFGTTLC